MSFFEGSKFVTELTPKDFDEREPWNLKSSRCCIVLYYLRRCPHCIDMKQTWLKLAERAAFFDVCAFDAVAYPEHVSVLRNEMPAMIKGYPTIIIYEKGKIKRNYEGERTVNALTNELMNACSL